MLRDVLQGKPLRHPLHPLLVHLPIGFFFLVLVLDAASYVFESAGLVRAAFYALAAGLIGAAVAAVPGFVDYADIRDDHPAKKVATLHMMLNLLMVGIYGASFGLRVGSVDAASTPILPLLVSLGGFAVLSVSGYLGGRIVYEEGVAVGRHRRRTPTPQRTIGVAVSPRAKDDQNYVPMIAASDILPGATARVDVNGTVICVVRLEEKFYAFQEFCTHRFGPLSEGSFHGCEAECPWHRSRFDVRTGKAVKGPAKADLKTWATEVRDGKVCIRLAETVKASQPELLGVDSAKPEQKEPEMER
jgi:nitrite reductase/ring-hydroxylating ferredoxin subunit/uncharacterized membrane protein